jgi:hypothetical protein
MLDELTRSASSVILPRLAEGGGTVVCVASGPSLVAEDVEYVRGKATVIAINDAVRLAPWADVVYSSDKLWLMRNCKTLQAHPGIKVKVHAGMEKPTARPVDGKHCPGCRLRLPANGICWCDGMVTLRNAGPRGLSLNPTAIVTGDNSGTAAINVAVHLGPTRILLLGYDMGTHHGRRHFFDTEPQSCSSPFDKFRKLTATMVEPLKAAGIEVINCSRRTALECFPVMPLREALA